jgi:Ca2+-binding RTX toxin-like protein
MADFSLTDGPDTFNGTGADDTVDGTNLTLNPGDSLTGGAGFDTLVLTNAGTFRVDRLATFTGFEQITYQNDTLDSGTLFLGSQSIAVSEEGFGNGVVLGSGAVTFIGDGAKEGASVFSTSAANWNAGNSIAFRSPAQGPLFGDGSIALNTGGLTNAVYDLTTNTFSHVAVLSGAGTKLTLKINSAVAGGVTNFVGSGSNDRLLTSDAALDLSHSTVKGFSVASSNATGTNFTVHDFATASQITGGAGTDTITALGFTFSAGQRDTIFATISVERIVDSSGTYTAPSPGPNLFTLTTGSDTVNGTAGNDTVNAGAATLNPADSLTGGPGADTLALWGSGTFRVDRLAAFTGFETVTLNNYTSDNVAVFLGSQSNLTVQVVSAAAAGGIASFFGSGTNDRLVTSGATLDLTTSTLSGYSIASSNTTGTNFIVGDLATALKVAGGSGTDTLTAQFFAFTAAQRHSIFATSSIEKIIDQSGTYTTDVASSTITSNGAGDTAAVSVFENNTAVTTVTATKPDPAFTLTYSVIGGADAGKFAINAATGALSFVTAPNFELPGDTGGNNVYDVIVQASDGHGGIDSQAIAVTVGDVLGVTINGTAGNDIIDRTHTVAGQPFPTLEGDNLHLGAGNDYFTWNPGDGSDTVDGQAGYDALVFNGANTGETIDISAAAGHAHLFHDIDNTTLDLTGVEAIIVDAFGGADTVKVGNMTGTGVSEVYVNLAAVGGGGDGQIDNVSASGTEANDSIQISGTGANITVTGASAYVSVLSSEAQDQLTVSGLGGDDYLSAASLTSTVSLTLDGGAGNDTIIGNAAANTLISGAGHDYLIGLGGNDILIGGSDPVALQGGTGDDVYIVQAPGASITEFAGEGTDEVQTFLASFTLRDNVENLVFVGNFSHTGIGTADNNRFTGAGANDTFTGGGGADIFDYRHAGNGLDTITDFDAANASAGHDLIDLSGRGLSFASLAVTPTVGGTIIGIAGGDAVFLAGVTSGIDHGDFLF